MNVRIWHSATGFKTTVFPIHQDDTIGVARAKIAEALGVSPARVHMWASLKIAKSWQFVTNIASRVMTPSWDATLKQLEDLFDLQFRKPRGQAVPTIHSIARLIFDSDAEFAQVSLGYTWKFNTNEIVFHPNPYADMHMDPRFLNSFLVLTSYEATVLETYRFASKFINVCILRGELEQDGPTWGLGFTRKYFPQLPVASDYTRADKQLQELHDSPSQKWTQLGPRIAYMQVSVNKNDNSSSYDLMQVFNAFEAGKNVPVCCYSGKYFKISRKHRMPNTMVDHEMKRNAKDPPRGTYIKWYAHVDNSSCLILTLHPNLQYIVELKSSGKLDASVASAALRGTQKVIEQCRVHLPIDAYIPDVDDVWKAQRMGSTTLLNRIVLRTDFFATEYATPTAAAFAKEIQKLDALMHVVGQQGNSVMLQYTRVSDHVQLSPMQYYTVMHLYRPRAVLLRMIREKFDVDMQTASDAIAHATSVSQQRDRTEIRDTLATAVVQCKQIIVRVDIKCRSMAVADRMLAIIKAVVVPQKKQQKQIVQESNSEFDMFFDDISEIEESDDDNDDEFEADVRSDRYILDMLTHTDPELFKYQVPGYVSYATQCGKVDARQPIALTPAEMARQNEVNPSGYGDAVYHGSSPDDPNYYACPDVWCPKSKLAYTHDQFTKCPLPNEEALTFKSKYWKGSRKGGHIGFLKPSKHPQGLCMPCCFSIPKRQFDTCMHKTSSDINTYVKAPQLTLDENRLSLVPQALMGLLRGTRCGTRHDGSGVIPPNNTCIVRVGSRVGITFVELLSERLALGSVDRVVRNLTDLDQSQFLSLQGGAIARNYVQKAASATRQELLKTARELYTADVVHNGSFQMTIDNFCIKYKISVVVIEMRPTEETVEAYVHCANQTPNGDIVVVLKWPGNRFDMVASAAVTTDLKLEYKLSDSKLSSLVSSCFAQKNDGVLDIVRQHFKVSHWVIDPVTIAVRGAIVDDIFVPFPEDVLSLPEDGEWMFLDEVLSFPTKTSMSRVTKVIDTMRRVTGDDRYTITHVLSDHGRVIALHMPDAIIPVDYASFRKLPQAAWFTFDVQSLRDISENVDNKAYADAVDESIAARRMPSFMLAMSCDFQTRQRLRFAGSSFNPFPFSVRLADAKRVITEFIDNARRNNPALMAKDLHIIPILIERVAKLCVIGSEGCTFSYRSTQTASKNDIVLTAAQVTAGQTEVDMF